MAVKTFKAQTKNASASKGKTSNRYVGEVPPSGAYRCAVKRMTIKNNSKGDPMITALFEIAETDGPAQKYNGYGFFENFNITDVGAPFINQFLTAMVGDDKKKQKAILDGLWDSDKGIKAVPDERAKETYQVRKIGSVVIGSPDKIDFTLVVSADQGVQTAGANKGKSLLNATGYKPLEEESEGAAEDDEDFEDFEDDEDETEDTEVDDEATDSEEPDEDDEEVEDEDEEDLF